ncbi:MAG: ATP-binding protein [Muribaculaceae bacterium]|nr:ATP-binding protein [Muribaculaceae bacterium]
MKLFKRKLYGALLQWKEQWQGKYAVLIEGARRVGKSTLAKSFAKHEYKSYLLIDFSKASREVNALFEDMMDLDYFFIKLQSIFHVNLYPRESVIIFDEVQFQPLARQAIKHLVKDGRYDYIETGSLISIRRNVKDILIPSEEIRMTLYPLDLEEFYWATNKEVTPTQQREAFSMNRAMGDAVHRIWMRELRLYMLVGGMPQAVEAYIETNNLQAVDTVKRHILRLYDEDFHKIDPSGRISELFNAIPAQLNSNASRYQVGSVLENQTAERIAELVTEMKDSGTILLSHHCNDPQVGLEFHKSLYHYKIYLVDTGLFVTLAFRDKNYTENLIYNKLLSDKLQANLGYVYENLVAQMLRTAGNELYYYTFPTGKGNTNYEIDFLLSRGDKIVPIEVKSSGYKTHKSLDTFCDKYSSRIGQKYVLYTKDYHKDGSIIYLPIYFTHLL